MESHNARREPRADARLERAARLSRYVLRQLEADPRLGFDPRIDHPFSAEEMRAELASAPAGADDSLKRSLRTLRKRTMLRLITRDLAGLAPLAEVMGTATALAEVALGLALARLHQELADQHGQPMGAESGRPQQLHIVAMGKLGG